MCRRESVYFYGKRNTRNQVIFYWRSANSAVLSPDCRCSGKKQRSRKCESSYGLSQEYFPALGHRIVKRHFGNQMCHMPIDRHH